MTQHDDMLYVALMRDEVRGVMEAVDDCSRDEFIADKRRQNAAAYHFMRLAERPLKASPAFRAEHSEIPWDDLARVRERVEPELFREDPQAMWEIATVEFPALIDRLEGLLPPEDVWRYRPDGDGDDAAEGGVPSTDPEWVDQSTLARLPVSADALDEVCRRYDVRRVRVFGSVLRDDFGPESDIDMVVDFGPDAPNGWKILGLDEELTELMGHTADVMHGRPVRYIRDQVLAEARTVYVRTDDSAEKGGR